MNNDYARWLLIYIAGDSYMGEVSGLSVDSLNHIFRQSNKFGPCFPFYGTRAEAMPFTLPENRPLVDALCERWAPVLERARRAIANGAVLDDTPVRNARVQQS